MLLVDFPFRLVYVLPDAIRVSSQILLRITNGVCKNMELCTLTAIIFASNGSHVADSDAVSGVCLESLSDDDTHVFLLILYQLVPQLSVTAAKTGIATAAEADDSDSDDETMDVDGQVHFLTFSLVAGNIHSLLDSQLEVCGILSLCSH